MKKVILANLAILLGGLFLLELVFGSWFSGPSPLLQFTKPRNVQKTYTSGFAGQPDPSRYTIDGNGLRGLDKGLGDIFILTAGGSTTDQKYIDDGHTFEEQLEALFREDGRDVDIVSGGIDGQSTFGHLENFPGWYEKMPGFSPRYILFYVGVNDFYILDEMPSFDRLEKGGQPSALRRLGAMIADKSALYAAGRIAASIVSPPDVAHFKGGKPKPFSPQTWTQQTNVANYRTAPVEESLRQLGERISALAKATREIGSKPIFVTQRSVNWIEHEGQVWGLKAANPRRNAKALEDMRPLTGVDIYWLERLQAAAIMGTCEKENGICIDLAGNMAVDHVSDFYDPVHTTPAGSRKIAEFLHSRLKDLK